MLWYEMGMVLLLALYTSGSSFFHPLICTDCYPACACTASTERIDNGLDSHPRFVPSLVCDEKKCFNHLRCRGLKYALKILMPKSEASTQRPSRYGPINGINPWDMSMNNLQVIPEKMRPHYWLREINITVACVCSF